MKIPIKIQISYNWVYGEWASIVSWIGLYILDIQGQKIAPTNKFAWSIFFMCWDILSGTEFLRLVFVFRKILEKHTIDT